MKGTTITCYLMLGFVRVGGPANSAKVVCVEGAPWRGRPREVVVATSLGRWVCWMMVMHCKSSLDQNLGRQVGQPLRCFPSSKRSRQLGIVGGLRGSKWDKTPGVSVGACSPCPRVPCQPLEAWVSHAQGGCCGGVRAGLPHVVCSPKWGACSLGSSSAKSEYEA